MEDGAAHRFGGGGGAQAVVTFARKQEGGMTMGFPELTEQLERALGQGDVTIGGAFAAANMQELALGVDVADFQVQAFAQAQAAGIDRGQSDPMIEALDLVENAPDFAGGEHDGQFELEWGADQDQFLRPFPAEGCFPKEFDLPAGRQVAQRAWVEVW